LRSDAAQRLPVETASIAWVASLRRLALNKDLDVPRVLPLFRKNVIMALGKYNDRRGLD